MLWALLYLRWITNELLCSTGNSAQLYDSLDGRGVFGTRIPGYIELSLFTFHLKLRILLISYAAKLIQSCLTLCDPIDGSPPGSTIPRILQARTLEWVAILIPTKLALCHL